MGTRKHRKSKKSNKRFRKTRSRRQRGGDNDRLLSYIRDEERDLEYLKREKQRVINEKEEKEKKVITARLITEKAKKKDGKDLVPRAKRDSATVVSGFLRMTQEELNEYNNEIAYLTQEIEDSENHIHSLYEEYNTEELVEAIEVGDIDNVISALENGADVNTKIEDTPILLRAIVHGDVEIVKILLKQPDIDVNAQQPDNMGATALIKALRSLKYSQQYEKTIEIIKLLLKDKRTDVSIDTVYSTALNAARHNKAPQEIIDLIREREERKKNIAMTRLVTGKAKLEDGRDLVPVAKRDVATSISKFFGGKRNKTRKHKKNKKGGTKETKPKNKTIKTNINKKVGAENIKLDIEKTRPLHFSEYEEWYEIVANEDLHSQLPYMRYLNDYHKK
jgi:hypothetical protein